MLKDNFGYIGRILEVDLTSGRTEFTPLPDDLADNYLGGKGFGARILYDRLPAGVDPLSPENIIVFAAGPLTGTLTPTSGRSVLCTKSPLTNLWLDSNCGGSFGPEMKSAGCDALVLTGKAAVPSILVIDRGRVEIKEAGDWWGLDTISVHAKVKEEYGEQARVATIGPAGESGVLFANVVADYRAFGRGGAGAMMGAKNLKAIVCRGGFSAKVFNPEEYIRICREAYNELAVDPEAGGGRQIYGTNQILSAMNATGLHPVRNFTKGVFDGADRVSEQTISEFYVRNRACFGCPIYCSKIARVKDGKYAGAFVEGPEFENSWAFGANLDNTDVGAIIQAEYLADYYGFDSISAGSTIGFLMECYQDGLIKREDLGFELKFGDDDAIIKALHMIGRREGPGRDWGLGTKRLEKLIPGSPGKAMQVKGLELPAYEPRGSTGMALAFASADRGGCHLRAWPLGAELLATDGRMDPLAVEYKAEFVMTQQDLFTIFNAATVCMFASSAMTMRQITRLLHAITGREAFASSESIYTAGARINNLVRLFNLREGLTRADDRLPERFMTEALREGPIAGLTVPMDELIDEYYLCRGWDKDGKPIESKLAELGLVEEK